MIPMPCTGFLQTNECMCERVRVYLCHEYSFLLTPPGGYPSVSIRDPGFRPTFRSRS